MKTSVEIFKDTINNLIPSVKDEIYTICSEMNRYNNLEYGFRSILEKLGSPIKQLAGVVILESGQFREFFVDGYVFLMPSTKVCLENVDYVLQFAPEVELTYYPAGEDEFDILTFNL